MKRDRRVRMKAVPSTLVRRQEKAELRMRRIWFDSKEVPRVRRGWKREALL